VRACPTGARHFGDLADPDSAASRLVAERGGFDLMPELGYAPTNKYLPPRPRRAAGEDTDAHPLDPAEPRGGFLAWLDRMLTD
jgi:Fe-S-cluster-containing dehydrogenase component